MLEMDLLFLCDATASSPAHQNAICCLCAFLQKALNYIQTIPAEEWLKFIGAVVGGVFALVAFWNSNRIKSAELLVSMEKDYARLIPALLQIERDQDYEEEYKVAIEKSLFTNTARMTPKEVRRMDKLEAMLRYFHMCNGVRNLGVNKKAMQQLCHYYLRVLVPDNSEIDGKPYYSDKKRPELVRYVRVYWPSVYIWAVQTFWQNREIDPIAMARYKATNILEPAPLSPSDQARSKSGPAGI